MWTTIRGTPLNIICRKVNGLILRRMASSQSLRLTSRPHHEGIRVNEKVRKERGFCADKHSVFRDLQLKKLKYEGPFGRCRQHVNPLSIKYQTRTESLNWSEVFEDPKRPLIVDVGTGYGRFPVLAATQDGQKFNYLGTEIRTKLVDRANFWAKSLDVSNRVHYVFCNITISLESLLSGYPGLVHGIYIQFPDPLFKKKQIKRHIVQSEFVEASASVLRPGGLVFMQSDVKSCAMYMKQMYETYGFHQFSPNSLHEPSSTRNEKGKLPSWDSLSWLEENPIGWPTEREVYSLDRGQPIYRMLLTRI